MKTPNIKTLAANMKKAAFNRKEVAIAGGIFEASELKAGADALEAFPDLLSSCERVLSKWTPETGRKLERLLGTETVNMLNNAVKQAKGQQ